MKCQKRNTKGQSSQKLLGCRTRVPQRVYALPFLVPERNPMVTRLCFFLTRTLAFRLYIYKKTFPNILSFFPIDTDKLLSVFPSALSFHSQTRIFTVFDFNNNIFSMNKTALSGMDE